MSEKSADELVIERVLSAPRTLVYQAFTDPERMKSWWGPRDFTPLAIELDVRPGGKWRGGMRDPDGKEHFARGVYREVVPDEKLVFTYTWEKGSGVPDETQCTLELSDLEGGKTRMVFRQGPFSSADERDGHQDGWGEAFAKLPGANPQ